jgi:hypothetical protein
MGKNQHVVPHNGGWGIRGEGNSRLTTIKPSKEKAVDLARDIARNQQSELVIHGRNGRIQDKDSYGNDPCPPRDTKH